MSAFNIALVGENGEFLHKSWDVAPRLFGVLKGYGNDPKVGPLTKGFFIVSKTGKRGTVQHNVAPVSPSSPWKRTTTPSHPTRRNSTPWTATVRTIIEIAKLKDLQELAEEIGRRVRMTAVPAACPAHRRRSTKRFVTASTSHASSSISRRPRAVLGVTTSVGRAWGGGSLLPDPE